MWIDTIFFKNHTKTSCAKEGLGFKKQWMEKTCDIKYYRDADRYIYDSDRVGTKHDFICGI